MTTAIRQTGPACATADPELFFIPPAGDPRPAKRICNACPIRETCLNEAMRNETPFRRYGIWGGLTPKQRDQLGRRRADLPPLHGHRNQRIQHLSRSGYSAQQIADMTGVSARTVMRVRSATTRAGFA